MSRSLILFMNAPEGVIQKLIESGIETIHDLVKAGAKPLNRKKIATAVGLDRAEIYTLVKQADLLRVEGLDATNAQLLVSAGIRGIADLAVCKPEKVLQRFAQLNTTSKTALPSADQLKTWKELAGDLKAVLYPDAEDLLYPGLTDTLLDGLNNPREEMFTDMVEMVTNLGRGIAVAQQEMDEQAIRTQKLINADQRLRDMGLMATWFTIPDATFNLKMNYSLVREQGAEHDAPAGRQKFRIMPLNARTQNYFKLSEGMQSELNIRFASLPPPPHISQPIIVPSLIGKTLEDAKVLLAAENLRAGTVTTVSGEPAGSSDTNVTAQSPEPGADARFQDRINLFIRRRTKPA